MEISKKIKFLAPTLLSMLKFVVFKGKIINLILNELGQEEYKIQPEMRDRATKLIKDLLKIQRD